MKQEVQLIIRYKTNHSPDTEYHLKNLLKLNNHFIKGEDIYEEDGKLYYEI